MRVPQRVKGGKTVCYFRSRDVMGKSELVVRAGEREVMRRKYPFLRPPEMERLEIDFGVLARGESVSVEIEE